MKRIVVFLLLTSATIAGILALAQNPFTHSTFEYGKFQPYAGTLEEWPVPVLSAKDANYLLVGAGKHGVAEAVRGLDHQLVTLNGSLIQRGSMRMLELLPSSLKPQHVPSSPSGRVSHGYAKFTGEIVDTKCYLGVMNPGEGKVHRSCAARCISGGVTPALAVDGRLLILVDSDDHAPNREIFRFAGERVTVTGEWIEAAGIEVPRASPATFRRE